MCECCARACVNTAASCQHLVALPSSDSILHLSAKILLGPPGGHRVEQQVFVSSVTGKDFNSSKAVLRSLKRLKQELASEDLQASPTSNRIWSPYVLFMCQLYYVSYMYNELLHT